MSHRFERKTKMLFLRNSYSWGILPHQNAHKRTQHVHLLFSGAAGFVHSALSIYTLPRDHHVIRVLAHQGGPGSTALHIVYISIFIFEFWRGDYRLVAPFVLPKTRFFLTASTGTCLNPSNHRSNEHCIYYITNTTPFYTQNKPFSSFLFLLSILF